MIKEKIYIFGAGSFAENVYDVLKEYYEIVGFIDNDVNKTGKMLQNKLIYSASILNNLNEKIIIASSWANEIEKQLEDIGYYNFDKMYSIHYCKLYLENLTMDKKIYKETIHNKIGSNKTILVWSDGAYSVFIESYLKSLSLMKNLKIFVMQNSKAKNYNGNYTRIDLDNLQEYNKFILMSNKFDVIHMHYIAPEYSIVVDNLRNKCDTFILTVWGSDFHQASTLDKRKQEKIYFLSDSITFANEKMYEEFIQEYGEIYCEKCSIRRFALPILNEIDQLRCKKNYENKLKEKYGIPKDKVIVNVGHSAIREDDHIAIINQLKELEIKDKLFYIFPLSYGIPNKELYIEEIRTELIKNNFDFLLIEDTMTNKEIAEIKLLLDIYINLIDMDNLSGSMLEALYAGTPVIYGNWLTYDMLSKKNMISINDMSELNSAMYNCINNLDKMKESDGENIKIVKELGGCEICSDKWIELIKTYIG